MPDKSCANCKHCRQLTPVHKHAEPLWVCEEYYGEECPVNVTPPYDEACDKWEGDDHA